MNENTDETSKKPSRLSELFDVAYEMILRALKVGNVMLTLLDTELALARASAMALVWLSAILLCLGIATWVSLAATLAVGIYTLTGHLFISIGSVALVHIIGIGIVIIAMRRRWRNLSLPRTRALLRTYAR